MFALTSDQQGILVHSAILFVIGVSTFWGAFALRRKQQFIENIPTSKIRSIALGLVEVHGRAEPFGGKYLRTPFSARNCVYYQYKVEKLKGSGKNRSWVTIAKHKSIEPFYIRDVTGKVLIHPANIETHLDVDHEYQTGLFSGEKGKQFLNQLIASGVANRGLFGLSGQYRAHEMYLEEADKVYVMGTAKRQDWQDGSATKGSEDIFITKGESRDPFVISDKSEKHLVGSLKWKVILMFCGGGAMAVGAIWLFVAGFVQGTLK